MSNRFILGMTGATGQIYGIRTLELLSTTDIEVHLVLSDASKINIQQEANYTLNEVTSLANEVHDNRNIGATIASGSFETNGMLVTPCSMKTLSNIANGNSSNLITRSADVILKERRRLVLMPREKPLNRIHLTNMLSATDAGAIIYPPFPSFYQKPKDIDEMITRTMARALSYFDISISFDEWAGL
tara:strand:+ start:137 stop:697 length:561 start_codon:yes stop_codon:yes gene_type:complete